MRSVFVIGDSISLDYDTCLKEYISGFATYSRKTGESAVDEVGSPFSKNGGNSEMVLQFLEHEKSKGTHFDIVMLNCGLHDIKHSIIDNSIAIGESDYRDNLCGIISILKKLANDIIWINSTPVEEERHNRLMHDFKRYSSELITYNNIAAEVMRANSIPIADLFTFTDSIKKEKYRDHVHFTGEVQSLQAAFLTGFVTQTLKK